MAQLKSDAIIVAAAVSSIMMTTSLRLSRNFSYYRTNPGDRKVVDRHELITICQKLNRDLFGFHNLLSEPDRLQSPFLVTLANQISDRLEELHRKLLYFEADDIADMIPELDTLRTFWSTYTDVSFYTDHLNQQLEEVIPLSMLKIESGIKLLPVRVIL